MSQGIDYNSNKGELKDVDAAEPVLSQAQILEYLQKSERTNSEILKSLTFIKRYYFWRSIINSLKIALVVIVVILGIVSWGTIVDIFTNGSFNDQSEIGEEVKERIWNKFENNQ